MKGVLAGEEVYYEGEIIQAYQARLQFKVEQPPLLWVATRGDITLKTAGEYADGVIVATDATPSGVAEGVALVKQGAARVGRPMESMRIMSRVDTCVHSDFQKAYDGTRIMIARFLWSSYPDRNFVQREGLAVPAEIEALIAKRDYSLVPQAAAMIPDDFVRAFCWAGTPEMVAERIVAIARETGVEEFGFWALLAPGQSREGAMRLIGEEVVPRVRQALGDRG
jgi:alkanesulfonate monooxygenase SsuD/methylene tetrahydromethanopterin reductase-like flavin-dependent oxidoreductase (luciferase family)